MIVRAALLALAAGLAAQPALACSCGSCADMSARRVEKMIEEADYIAHGTVISGSEQTSGEYAFRLKLTKILKGKLVEFLDLHAGADSCGIRMPVGRSFDVIAGRMTNSTDGKLYVSLCGQVCADEVGIFDRLEKKGRPVP